MYPDQFLEKKMAGKLPVYINQDSIAPSGTIDFSSSDYLGIKKNSLIQQWLKHQADAGAPLNYWRSDKLIPMLEERMAEFHGTDAALLFNSGYAAAIALFSTVPGRGDTIIYDEKVHPAFRDAIRLSQAEAYPFLHNDVENLNYRLNRKTGNTFVVTETYFCAEGAAIPLPAIVHLCERHGAHLIVHESCSLGVHGSRGQGLVQEMGLEKRVFCRLSAFSIILGASGGAILGSEKLKDYLSAYAAAYISSPILSTESMLPVWAAYHIFPDMDQEREQIRSLHRQFNEAVLPFSKAVCEMPVQSISIAGNNTSKRVQKLLKESGFHIRQFSKTGKNSEVHTVGFHFHSFNTEEELDALLNVIRETNYDRFNTKVPPPANDPY